MADKQILLETLNDLRSEELNEFKSLILLDSEGPLILRKTLKSANTRNVVEVMLETWSQESMKLTTTILKKMNRTDLVEKLSDPSLVLSGPSAEASSIKTLADDKHFIDKYRVELIRSVRNTVPILDGLLNEMVIDIQRFDEIKTLPTLQGKMKYLLSYCLRNKKSKDVFYELLKDYEPYLIDHLKTKEDENIPDKVEVKATVTAKQMLLETLNDLSSEELDEFMTLIELEKDFPSFLRMRLNSANAQNTMQLLLETDSRECVELTKRVLKTMNRTDLVQRWSDMSSGTKEKLPADETQPTLTESQDPSDWTKLDPEVKSTDADEAPTYSLQSDAGRFECSVSGLRWLCEENVCLKYQFCSWEGHKERMESMQYMPAGPLMDVTVISGKLKDVYLPHWICIEDDPTLIDKFAVLHIVDCGDVVEEVSEVTPSHVKLPEPVFTLRASLIKRNPAKISCNVLIYYKPNTSFLKLHVFLIPLDPALQQAMDKKKISNGFKIIEKSRPNKKLKLEHDYKLEAVIDTSAVEPEEITLRHEPQGPNFYEVYIDKPDREFDLLLSHLYTTKGKLQSEEVWKRKIRKDDYQNSSILEGKDSVDEPGAALTQKAAANPMDRKRLLDMLGHLKQEEFKKFKWLFEDKGLLAGLPCIPGAELEKMDGLDLADRILNTYTQKTVEVLKKVFSNIPRNDLVETLETYSSETSASGSSS